MGDLLGPPVGLAAVGSQLTANYIRIDRQLNCATTSTRNSRVVDCTILDMYCLKRSVVLYVCRTSASTSSYGFHMDSYGTILLCGGIRLTQSFFIGRNNSRFGKSLVLLEHTSSWRNASNLSRHNGWYGCLPRKCSWTFWRAEVTP